MGRGRAGGGDGGRAAELEPVAAQAEVGGELVTGQGDRAGAAHHGQVLHAAADLAQAVPLGHVDPQETADRRESRLYGAHRYVGCPGVHRVGGHRITEVGDSRESPARRVATRRRRVLRQRDAAGGPARGPCLAVQHLPRRGRHLCVGGGAVLVGKAGVHLARGCVADLAPGADEGEGVAAGGYGLSFEFGLAPLARPDHRRFGGHHTVHVVLQRQDVVRFAVRLSDQGSLVGASPDTGDAGLQFAKRRRRRLGPGLSRLGH